MRRLEYLMKTVRNSTDLKDVNSIKDNELIEYFNAGQKRIQSLIFQADMESDLFDKEALYSLVSGQAGYDLPSDIFAGTSVSYVERLLNETYMPMDKIQESERNSLTGYSIMQNQIRVHPTPKSNGSEDMRLIYSQIAPKLDVRRGIIKEVVSATKIKFTDIDDNFSDEKIQEYDEHFCIVSTDGTIKSSGLLATKIIGTTVTFTGDATSAEVGDYMVMGELSSTHSILPTGVECYLLDYVRMRAYLRDSQDSDVSSQTYFTNGTEQEIVDLYANNDKDVIHPPLTDTDFMGY